MAAATIHIDVVSAEEAIFSGEAEFVVLPGEAGELGVYPRHTPLITRIKPGVVRIQARRRGGNRVRGGRNPRSAAQDDHRAGRYRDTRQGPRRSEGERSPAKGRGSQAQRQ